MALRDLPFKVAYATEEDDLVSDFFAPCFQTALRYDRITGYFSSSIYRLTWPALRDFIARGGRIRLLCSPYLTDADAEGLEFGYRARSEEELEVQLHAELKNMLDSEEMRAPARLLASLIAAGSLEVLLASVSAPATSQIRSMFHDKVGIFSDAEGNLVGFGGSLNESMAGIRHNVESISVWPSWDSGRDAERVESASSRFENLWTGNAMGVRIHQLPAGLSEVIKRVASEVDLADLWDEVESGAVNPRDRRIAMKFRDHQTRALVRWESNGYRGLLAHATGSGKTITGLEAIRSAMEAGFTPVVIVPSALLLRQWDSQLRDRLGVQPILCGDGHTEWRSSGLLRTVVENGSEHVIVAVLRTASSGPFLGQLQPYEEKLLLVADEVHRLGSQESRPILERLSASRRLGLSATPKRYGDPEGTARIYGYFDKVVDTYTLKDALDDGHLTPYEYSIAFVSLSEEEQESWEDLTKQIKRLYGQMSGEQSPPPGLQRHAKMLLIKRSRIVKKATQKPAVAASVLADNFRKGQRWLIYCDDKEQVESTISALEAKGMAASRYFTGMEDDGAQVLKQFEAVGGIVVSIRCLDEGVDIPAADHALLLASSRNPREHIQRRGRVLRTSTGKSHARLFDAITLPRHIDIEDDTWKVTAAEIVRAASFDDWSMTPGRVRGELREKWADLMLPLALFDEVLDEGLEDEEDEE